MRVPMAFVAKVGEMDFHAGVVASALSVRQIPPPAAAIHRRQKVALHPGATAKAVTRPDVTYSRPLYVIGAGNVAMLGPNSFQFRNGFAGLSAIVSCWRISKACQDRIAFSVAVKGISTAG